MTAVALVLVLTPLVLTVYCWVLYPLMVARLSRSEGDPAPESTENCCPHISVVLAAHNAEACLARALTALVNDDYPSSLRDVFVVSDGSRDGTAHVVRSFEGQNVHLLQSYIRLGKTGAENLAAHHIQSEIVVCTDASVQIEPGSLRALVNELARPDVGVVSGTDVAIASRGSLGMGERSYVRAEMWLRRNESEWSGLVGASGCLYAMRRSLFIPSLPSSLTRDFGTVLLARRLGWRTVAVEGARCRVGTSTGVATEYARKVRTVVQGLETLSYFKDMLNPLRYGRFAFALFSHKLCRWLIPLSIPVAAVGGTYLLAVHTGLLVWVATLAALMLAVLGFRKTALAAAPYAFLVQLATLSAWMRFVLGQRIAIWTPTARVSSEEWCPEGSRYDEDVEQSECRLAAAGWEHQALESMQQVDRV